MISAGATVRNAVRRALLMRGRDVTETVAIRSALILAPHPDDETLGCGARTLLARRRGTSITVVVATDGAKSHAAVGADADALQALRSDELHVAMSRLGVEARDTFELGYPDGELSRYVDDLADELRQLIKVRRPEDVYVTCSSDWHPDHAAAAQALKIAIRETHPQPRLLEYPIWLWADWPLSRRHRNGRALWQAASILIRGQVETVTVREVEHEKRAALSAYASQFGDDVALPEQIITRALNGPELYFRSQNGNDHRAAG